MVATFPGRSLDATLANPPTDHEGPDPEPSGDARVGYAELYAIVSAFAPPGKGCSVEVRTARVCAPHRRAVAVTTWFASIGPHGFSAPTPELVLERLRAWLRAEGHDLTGIADRMHEIP